MRGRGPIALLPVWMGRVCLLSGAKHRESSEVLKTVRHDCSVLASAGTGQGALTGLPVGRGRPLVCAWRSVLLCFRWPGGEGPLRDMRLAVLGKQTSVHLVWGADKLGGSLNCLNTEFVII